MSLMTSLNLLAIEIAADPEFGKEIYTKGDTKLSEIIENVIKLVGGIGGACFTLAVLIIALVIIFGSISPKNIGRWWTALFSCVAGAALFFSAFMLSSVLSNLFS
ncbi:TrbC/VirB2 family protein [Lysinibacillus irui]|uniref:TrbC/VirB2 family protein n=1 Tax=Lysinibacillus irui TaxID=2998077 RepID=A0AAJ5RMP1_9BACI|nr:TrbC/VirB2 family protein [Lysinibacillus irui]WDV09257.1 TrbC/VirB2 family protein [Lysinibacillus irui]